MFKNASEALNFILIHTDSSKRRHINAAAATIVKALAEATVDNTDTVNALIAEKEEIQNKLLEAVARAEAAETAAKPAPVKRRRTRTKKKEETDDKQSNQT